MLLKLNQVSWGLGICAILKSSSSQKSNVLLLLHHRKVNDFMGHRSMRKKNIILKQQQQQPQQPPMPSNSNTSSSFKTRHVVVLVSFLSAVAVIALSLNTWSFFRSDGRGVLSDEVYSYEVVNVFPHDPNAFTQGLLYGGNDTLLESTGLNGQSSVREVDLQTGKIKAIQNMDYSYFGEGLTLLGKRLYQVTWLGKTGFIYDRYNFTKFKTFTHNMKDGWGLATNGKILFGSDGSSSLYKINPQTMKVIKEHVVKYKGHEVHNLNELEYINDEVWANIWQSDCIARISPADGTVIGWILLPELRQELLATGNRIDVLNGIAWDQDKNRIFVTGKLWPKLYEIKLQPLRKPLQAPLERLCLRAPVHF
ncbi:glutamine cyclotransferase, WD40/YVTN repeat-like-containing domain protein [Artemisia annua]|uniref:Glutamine cyclotransferase, WD40/YVTN repeat-like-containing domain protein n=1 Tax=Artemisia annua TaxID=35608 RepID=A0A2U1LXH8_ARTAN|nr:glutamine cyclotransferase, WD40/YVTN repeat-like-containing domain protein [Artemisia annua]